jgi:hypothetical protein
VEGVIIVPIDKKGDKTDCRISPANVYHILTNSLGKQKVCAKWIPQVLNDDQRTMCVLATTHLQHREMKAVYSSIAF